MLRQFKSFQLAAEFYRNCKKLKLPKHLQDQLYRASSSIALNLAEGSGKLTPRDQKRFYAIALGSLRECQAILELEEIKQEDLVNLSDQLGAHIFRLCQSKDRPRKLDRI